MAKGCIERGYSYMAITDHSKAVTVANGLTPERVREQWEEVAEVRAELGDDFLLLRGQEVDILKDGSLDQPDDILEELDIVVIAVHSYMDMDRETMTARVLKGMDHPQVDILAHPTGRLVNRRDPYPIDMEAVLQRAADHDIAVEINAHPRRLDLNDRYAARARELGVRIVIDSDAHAVQGLDVMRFGVDQGRRAGLERANVLNCGTREEVTGWLARTRG